LTLVSLALNSAINWILAFFASSPKPITLLCHVNGSASGPNSSSRQLIPQDQNASLASESITSLSFATPPQRSHARVRGLGGLVLA